MKRIARPQCLTFFALVLVFLAHEVSSLLCHELLPCCAIPPETLRNRTTHSCNLQNCDLKHLLTLISLLP
jgi:hypothetical protein